VIKLNPYFRMSFNLSSKLFIIVLAAVHSVALESESEDAEAAEDINNSQYMSFLEFSLA